jgi:tetratricopeptide (TPR) repeat protein
MQKAISFFEISISHDSSFASAWAGLGEAYLESIYWHRIPNKVALPKAKYAVSKTLALDAESGEGYGLLGAISYVEKNLTEGEIHLRKAISLSPNNTFAYERLSWILVLQGRDKEAFELFDRIIQLDPLSTRNKGSIGNAYAILEKYDEGIQRIQKFLETDPNDNYLLWTLGYIYARKGDCDKTIEALNKRTIGKTTNWVLAYCYAKNGNKAMAEMILQNNIEKSKHAVIPDFMMAVMYNAVGRKEEALTHLELSLTNDGENFFVFRLRRDPMFESLINEPKFIKIADQAKKEYGIIK